MCAGGSVYVVSLHVSYIHVVSLHMLACCQSLHVVIYTCIHVSTCILVKIHACIHVPTYIYISPQHIGKYDRCHLHLHPCIHIHACIDTCMHSCTNIHLYLTSAHWGLRSARTRPTQYWVSTHSWTSLVFIKVSIQDAC
jgi:hypothetical protein